IYMNNIVIIFYLLNKYINNLEQVFIKLNNLNIKVIFKKAYITFPFIYLFSSYINKLYLYLSEDKLYTI
ncbi:hypothetical protein BO94DRAFT_480481, partial [Aspergillus sclerotioniger CBS 115572]